MNNNRLIILDTETTGLDPNSGHRIVEIGALELVNLIPTGNKFHYYLNPERDVPYEAYKVHGLSTEFLKDKPLFSHIVEEFLEFISESRLVIHNAKFDMKFINHELKLTANQTLDMSITIDTMLIARKRFPGARASLDDLCKRFKIDLSKRKYHGALLDAELLSELYIHLMGGANSRQAELQMTYQDVQQHTESVGKKYLYNANKIVMPNADEIEEHKKLILTIKNNLWEKELT
jgi:DNA polymerase-3 subunit epsilon